MSIELTPLREADRDPLFEWINDHDLVVLNAPFEPVARSDHDRWFDRIRAADDVAIFAIRPAGEDRMIGTCQLNAIDRDAGTAQFQIRIGDRSTWGRGHGTEAVRTLVRHAFDELGLERVGLQVIAGNDRAVRAYEKAGFRRVGTVPGGVTIDGKPRDVIEMEILSGGDRDG